MKEKEIQNDILRAHGARPDVRLFRQNVGQAWVGELVDKRGPYVTLKNARPFYAGLCVGSSDIVGIKEVEITADMVGQKIGVFTAIEVKQPRGYPSKEQRAFLAMVEGMGGLAGVARSADDAGMILGSGKSGSGATGAKNERDKSQEGENGDHVRNHDAGL